jgi:hypothetical protein
MAWHGMGWGRRPVLLEMELACLERHDRSQVPFLRRRCFVELRYTAGVVGGSVVLITT